MAEQLTGVLREVLSAADGQPRPAFSGLFSPELRAVGTDLSPGPANGNGNGTVNGTGTGNGAGNGNSTRTGTVPPR
jgi:hypothetical protein